MFFLAGARSSNVCGERLRPRLRSVVHSGAREGGAGRSQLDQHLPLTLITLASSPQMYFVQSMEIYVRLETPIFTLFIKSRMFARMLLVA